MCRCQFVSSNHVCSLRRSCAYFCVCHVLSFPVLSGRGCPFISFLCILIFFFLCGVHVCIFFVCLRITNGSYYILCPVNTLCPKIYLRWLLMMIRIFGGRWDDNWLDKLRNQLKWSKYMSMLMTRLSCRCCPLIYFKGLWSFVFVIFLW